MSSAGTLITALIKAVIKTACVAVFLFPFFVELFWLLLRFRSPRGLMSGMKILFAR